MTASLNRRGFLAGAMAVAGSTAAAAAAPTASAKTYQNGRSRWPICLNTSTIRPAPLEVKIDAAAKAGYDGIELWVNDLEEHEKAGGSAKDIGKRIADAGMWAPNVIGLWGCMPPTIEEWEAVLPATRERMRLSADAGSTHVAALPSPDRPDFDMRWGADRYRDLLRIGKEDYNIIPAFEYIGFLKGIKTLGLAAAIAIDADDPDACVVADTCHSYNGLGGFEGIRHVAGSLIAVFHWNDLPGEPQQGRLLDEHRLMPGDGILPLQRALENLLHIGYHGPLSLELFNRPLWEEDPHEVAKLGLEKMLESVALADA